MPAASLEANQPIGSNILTSAQGLDETAFWIYMAWQQGTDGAIQHYKVANGTQASYKSNVQPSDISDNWPGSLVADNGVKKSDISTLYSSDPKKLANGFLNVWAKHSGSKASSALATINSNKKDRLGRPFLRLKDIFKKYEKPNDGLTWERLAVIGNIENSLYTDTQTNDIYAGMFQMRKIYDTFKPYITRSFKGKSGFKDERGFLYDEYDIDIMTEGFVATSIPKFNEFKKATGFVPSSNSISTPQSRTVLPSASSVSPTTQTAIIIGDSLVTCLEINQIKKGGKSRRISTTGGESSLWLGGRGVSWLIGALKKYPVSSAVKHVIISIGTNGGFNTGTLDNQSGLMAELRRVFPNAKYLFVKGSYGWGGNAKVNEIDVTNYYNVYKNAGASITTTSLGYVATDAKAHDCNLATHPIIASEIIAFVGG
jgi:hypothetical protein